MRYTPKILEEGGDGEGSPPGGAELGPDGGMLPEPPAPVPPLPRVRPRPPRLAGDDFGLAAALALGFPISESAPKIIEDIPN